MRQPPQHDGHAPRIWLVAHRLSWLFTLLPALIAALWLAPGVAHAGTITIVDGPNTPPTGGVYTDGYIQAQLVASSLTITTTGVLTGPNEIRVLQGVTITWSAGTTLTLDAGSSVIISGTIQHDGPTSGAGGLQLLTTGVPTGTVIVGTGTQTVGVAAGSRFGLTRVQAGDLVLAGGDQAQTYAQLGFRAFDQGAAYTVTGPISVTVSHNLTATGGTNEFGVDAYAQVGHGGHNASFHDAVSGNFTGPITVVAGEDVTFRGGTGEFAYAQLGNGGRLAWGNQGGDHRLEAGGDVAFLGGNGDGQYAVAHFGNGGANAYGDHTGSHTLIAGGAVTFQGGNTYDYALFGNGGLEAVGHARGSHTLIAGGAVTFQGGALFSAYAQLGNGGTFASGAHFGSHSLQAGGDVTFAGNGYQAYAQLGNGGYQAFGGNGGDHALAAAGNVTFYGGDYSQAFMGNGGFEATGHNGGNHTLAAGGDVLFRGDGESDNAGYAQFGNGALRGGGNLTGTLTLTATGNLNMIAGQGANGYALIGHGAPPDSGNRSGDITLRVGETAIFIGAQVGHLTTSGVLSITHSNLLVGVGQSLSTAAGKLLIAANPNSTFNSAPAANGGELRFYLPRTDSQQIPINAVLNGESFAITDTIPAGRIQGSFAFGEGPYTPSYSFYLGVQPDVAIGKTAMPIDLLRPGAAITYTVSFSNTSSVVAAGIVITDLLPGAVLFSSATPQPDAGVTITQTGNAPVLAWRVSDLSPGKGGKLIVTATVQNSALLLGATFTNTATITATGDFTHGNNVAAVARTVVPGATLIITKTVVGDPPATPWQFTGSGGLGGFTLPKAGGSRSFSGLIPTTYTLTETVKAGYRAAVSCTDGAFGAERVQVTLIPGSALGCTFTNTYITQTLTLEKVVVGGPAAADDFGLLIDGTPVNRGVANLLSAGQHTVTETAVATYTASFGGACAASGQVDLPVGSHLTCTITNTYTPQTGSVAGTVYVDENHNDQPDTGEALEGLTVTLQSETGIVAALTLTDRSDSNGEYGFADVPVGDYILSFTVPTGYQSIADAPVTVTPGQTITVPVQVTARALPFTLFVPILHHLNGEPPPTR